MPALIPVVGGAVDFTTSFQPASGLALMGLVAATAIVVAAARRLTPLTVGVRSMHVRPGGRMLRAVQSRAPQAHGGFV
jgi:hypothetical protein